MDAMSDFRKHRPRTRRMHIAGSTANAVGNVTIAWWCSTLGGDIGMIGLLAWSLITLLELRRDFDL